MTGHVPDRWRTDAALDVLLHEADRARRSLGVAVATINVWERDRRLLRTLVSADVLGAGEEAKPPDEVYPVETFPALARLLEQRVPYCFGHGDPVDVSSASLAASLGMDTQASAAIVLHGQVWGTLWVATAPGDRGLTIADIPRIVRAANEVARLLAEMH